MLALFAKGGRITEQEQRTNWLSLTHEQEAAFKAVLRSVVCLRAAAYLLMYCAHISRIPHLALNLRSAAGTNIPLRHSSARVSYCWPDLTTWAQLLLRTFLCAIPLRAAATAGLTYLALGFSPFSELSLRT